jgi:hypothetical protein
MKSKLGLALVCLVLCVLLVGQVGCSAVSSMSLDPQTVAGLAQVATQTAGAAAVPKIIPVATAQKIVRVLDTVQPVAKGLTSVADLRTTLTPAIDAALARAIPETTPLALAEGVVSAAVGVAQSYLTAHPDIAKQAGAVATVASAALQGLRDGLAAKAGG